MKKTRYHRFPKISYWDKNASVPLAIMQYANALNKTGYYINCHYLPSRLHYCTINNGGDIDVSSINKWPFSVCDCSIKHCAPQPISKIQAHRRAMYYRKYSRLAHDQKHVCGFYPLNTARYVKFLKAWNDFGIS